jgi:hypothetical protein
MRHGSRNKMVSVGKDLILTSNPSQRPAITCDHLL